MESTDEYRLLCCVISTQMHNRQEIIGQGLKGPVDRYGDTDLNHVSNLIRRFVDITIVKWEI